MANEIQTKKEQVFLSDLQSIVAMARRKGYEAVNQIIVICNWLIGRRIVEQEQQGKQRAEYGKRVIKMASEFLTGEFGNGFSETNLRNFRKFYLLFDSIITVPMNSSGAPDESSEKKEIAGVPAESLMKQIGQTHLPNLTWTHYERLIRVSDTDARNWYMKEAEQCGWSYRTLDRNISSQYYYRLLQTPKQHQQRVVDEMLQNTADFQRDKLEIMKNPVVAEFLGLSQNTDFTETDLETAIINHIQQFIMEMGKGYAFVARQKHIKTDMGDYYIDLVFYNYKMRCFVLIDLKTSQITHQDVGQMDMYRRMYDALERNDGDNPTIGLLLCAETSKDLAQYSILHDNDNLFAAKYMTYLPKKEELLTEIERQKQIFALQQGKLIDNNETR